MGPRKASRPQLGPLSPCGPTPYLDSRMERVANSSLLAACYSALFSPVPFLYYWFSSLAVCFTLFALCCFFFAVDSSLLAASFLLFTDLYSLLASRWSVLSSSCLIIISLSSPLAVICMLYITWCMLFVIPKLAAHTCRSLIAVRKPWIVARCSLCVTRFSLPSPPSVAAECLIFALRCSLIIYHSYLLASHTFFLNARSSLKRSAVFQLHISLFGARFLFRAAHCLLPGSSVW